MKLIPNRGDVILFNFNPTSGHEQSGYRPALVLSGQALNALTNIVTVCPITSNSRGNYFEAKIANKKTNGVILIYQIRAVDFTARKIKIVDKVDNLILKEVIEKVKVLLEG